MNMFKKRNVILIISIFLVIFSVYHTWFFSTGILSHGDWTFFFPETQAYFYHFSFSIWNNVNSLGRVVLEMGQAPTFFAYGLLGNLFGTDFSLNERIIYFFPIALLTPISSYILLNKFFQSRVAVLIGVLTYSFNTYFLVIQTGHLTLMAAFSLAPLILYLYINTLETKKIIWAIICGLFFYLSSMYEPRGAYILSGVLFLYSLYFMLFLKGGHSLNNVVKTFILAYLPFLIVGLLNFYWIFTLINIGVIASNELFQRSLYGNEFFSILNSFTLFHPFWTGAKLEIATSQPIAAYFWLYPILALLGLIINRKNKYIVFFAAISLIGIFLTKQSDIPFSNVYSWLYEHFPGFNAFREASKFYSLTALGYSVLIASFFSWLWQKELNTSLKKYLRYIITISFISLLLWNTKPLITGEIGALFKTRTSPADFLIVRDFLLNQNSYFRTLWIPVTSRWSTQTALHPMISMGNKVDTDWGQILKTWDIDVRQENNIVESLRSRKIEDLLSRASIKYVIVSTRLSDNEEDWTGPVDNRVFYINEVNKLFFLKKVDIGTKEIAIYENKNFRPHIYLTKEKESTTSATAYSQVDHTFISPTEYKIEFKNVSNPTYVHFTETYHPGWKLYFGSADWRSFFVKNVSILSDKSHYQDEYNLNAFLLNPDEVCNDKLCDKNSDGSYNINMSLYFQPQAYIYPGLAVSGATLIICFGYILYYGIKKTKKN